MQQWVWGLAAVGVLAGGCVKQAVELADRGCEAGACAEGYLCDASTDRCIASCPVDCSTLAHVVSGSCYAAQGVARCSLAACNPGWRDGDGDTSNGCEQHCIPTNPSAEVCDG